MLQREYMLPSILNVLPSACAVILKCGVKRAWRVLREYFSNGRPPWTCPTLNCTLINNDAPPQFKRNYNSSSMSYDIISIFVLY